MRFLGVWGLECGGGGGRSITSEYQFWFTLDPGKLNSLNYLPGVAQSEMIHLDGNDISALETNR